MTRRIIGVFITNLIVCQQVMIKYVSNYIGTPFGESIGVSYFDTEEIN